MRRGAFLRSLGKAVGRDHVRTEPSRLVAYSYDATVQRSIPAAVVLPSSTEEVAAVLALCSDAGTPVVARGAATGLAAGAVPPPGSVVLNLARMREIREIDPQDGLAVVQPGVVTAHLHRAVEARGLFYPPDPASLQQCTIGGNLACNAGGPRCLRYGVTRDYVRGLTVVLASGEVLAPPARPLKSATGYALHQLFVGSEGTLGVITEATLRLVPLPAARACALLLLPSTEVAAEVTVEALQRGLQPAALELMDSLTLRLVDDVIRADFPSEARAALLVEADAADQATADHTVGQIAELAEALGAVEVRRANDAEQAAELWRARRSISAALGRVADSKLGEDVVVPRSRVPDLTDAIADIAADHDLRIPTFGHAGDGNLHPNILFDRHDAGEVARVESAAAAIFEAAIALGGHLSGEHGVGGLKRSYLERNLGRPTVDAMRLVKQALDPQGILNPGKVLPPPGGEPDLRGMLTPATQAASAPT